MFDTRLYSIIAETSTLASAKYSFKNSVLFTFLYFNSVLQNSLGFLLDFLSDEVQGETDERNQI